MPLASQTAQWRGRKHRFSLSGPWGPSWEIPGSALPSPPPRSPCSGGGNASRAQTPPPPPPPPPPPSPRLGACCYRRRGTRRVLSRQEKRREPSRRPAAGRERPAGRDARAARPGRPRAAPSTCAPRPGPGLRARRRTGRRFLGPHPRQPAGSSLGIPADPNPSRPLRGRARGKAGIERSRGVPAVLAARGSLGGRKFTATSLSPSWKKAKLVLRVKNDPGAPAGTLPLTRPSLPLAVLASPPSPLPPRISRASVLDRKSTRLNSSH